MIRKPIAITVDTTAIEFHNPFLKIFTEMVKKGVIEIYVDNYQFIEKCKWDDIKKRDEIIEWINRYTKTPIEAFSLAEGAEFPAEINLGLEKEQKIELKVRKIHSPEVKSLEFCKLSKFVDFRILTTHIKNSRDYFVTNNTKDFIDYGKQKNKRREQFESAFPGLKIRKLDMQFIDELRENISKDCLYLE